MPETLEKLRPDRDLQVYFERPSAIAAMSGATPTGFTASGAWRQQFDWCVIEWNRENVFEHPRFRNLPDGGTSAEGDALAVISDDPQNPGTATAHFDGCQFLSIGQGIHSRFSHILVENCYFTGHHGDNDDIDMYGESTPPPLIRNNVFLNPAHDDMINPTRCSAIIVGNRSA